MNVKIVAYTDGSCNNHTGEKGGYGIVFSENRGDPIQICGGRYDNSTSNRMEILAIVRTIEIAKERNPNVKKIQLIIHTDSAYAMNTIVRGWARNWNSSANFAGKKNKDLWRRCLKALDRIGEDNVEFVKVKGHSGIYYNEVADRLAGMGGNSEGITIDTPQ